MVIGVWTFQLVIGIWILSLIYDKGPLQMHEEGPMSPFRK